MPADTSLPQAPSAHHGDGDAPYPCSAWPEPPGGAAFIDYGYCRTSLDYHGPSSPQGHGDPRCPSTCPHKAPLKVAVGFGKQYTWHGAVKAAEWARKQRSKT
jgi:hypothetical protein